MRGCFDGSSMQTREERIRMRILMIFLLGLSYNQASGQDNSTQVYHAVLTAEEGAFQNISNMLKDFIVTEESLRVDNLAITTRCETLEDETQCTCMRKYIWSQHVCESQPRCCQKINNECSFPHESPSMCHPKTRVTVTGSVLQVGEKYYDSLGDSNSPRYLEYSKALISKMKPVYSTLKAFERLFITKFSPGSVIANFEMHINDRLTTNDLALKTKELSKLMNATFSLETAGLVTISKLDNPVRYGSANTITCLVEEDMRLDSLWHLTKMNKLYDIATGTESELTSTSRSAMINLYKASELWAGVFTCTFSPTSSLVAITHKASVKLDVALLPQIVITSEPQFPRCKEDSTEKVAVKVKCEIKNSPENYNVEWNIEGNQTEENVKRVYNTSENMTIYELDTTTGCLKQHQENPTTAMCTLINRRGQNRTATLKVNVIYKHSPFCAAEGGFPDTKAGFTARQGCEGSIGSRFRHCTTNAAWTKEVSQCVNQDLHSILEDTEIVDKGLGTVDGHAEVLFSRLTVATDTERINTYANVNASVTIIFNMQKLNHTFKESILDNVMESSSNILNDSFERVWTDEDDRESNESIAEKYLNSVEQMISRIHITKAITKSTSYLDVKACSSQTQKPHCENTVFNVTVSVESSDAGMVKTTGFKNLANYLPHDKPTRPNSIVVSTTIDTEDPGHPIQLRSIKIDFKLIDKRPRHHKMDCVSWDKINREWSTDGCKWDGPNNEGRCTCDHLSSFAILVSPYPQDVAFASEITMAGLVISVISLVVCLVTELLVWSAVVKSSSLYIRHTAHINISLSLLFADCVFLASSFPENFSANWCQVFVVLKHFFYLSMFFWMLCLSVVLLRQTVYVFHDLSKTKYLVASYFMGYAFPLFIVTVTFISYGNGAEGPYYTTKGCWLTYDGLLKGSIHTFIIPIGIIIFVNVFSMLVVIFKLLEHPKTSANPSQKQHKAAKSILRSVVILTPIFGVTWIFGFAVMAVDLAFGAIALVINYTFVLLNAFQGFFILLTVCLGDKTVRDALRKRLTTRSSSTSFKSETSSTTGTSTSPLDSKGKM